MNNPIVVRKGRTAAWGWACRVPGCAAFGAMAATPSRAGDAGRRHVRAWHTNERISS